MTRLGNQNLLFVPHPLDMFYFRDDKEFFQGGGVGGFGFRVLPLQWRRISYVQFRKGGGGFPPFVGWGTMDVMMLLSSSLDGDLIALQFK